MAHSRIDRTVVLVKGHSPLEVTKEMAQLFEFAPRQEIAISPVTGEFYCWMDRRKPRSEVAQLTSAEG